MPSPDFPRTYFYTDASDIPELVLRTMEDNEVSANIILPFVQKARTSRPADNQLWVVQRDKEDNVEFVLSCTKGPLGNYPIFIFTPKSSTQLHREEKLGKDIGLPLKELAVCLLQNVPAKRVFSVFSIASVAEAFAKVFVEVVKTKNIQDIQIENSYYYDATYTFCTRETIKKPSESFSSLQENEDVVISLHPADPSHLDALQSLYQGFSRTSEPYVLDDARARLEAQKLIENKQVWVHMIKVGEGNWDVACLVATTRESDKVTAITKVYTAEGWRRRGCAGRLVHRVTQDILMKKSCVVLYVGNGDSGELAAARQVYRKVGFQGLDSQQVQPEGVERWVEIGFTGTERGHW